MYQRYCLTSRRAVRSELSNSYTLQHHQAYRQCTHTLYNAGLLQLAPSSGSFSSRYSVLPAQRYASAGTSYGPVSVSVCLSQVGVNSIETDGRIGLVFGKGPSIDLSYPVLKENSGISKNKGTSLWNFILNSGLQIISQQYIDRRSVLST